MKVDMNDTLKEMRHGISMICVDYQLVFANLAQFSIQ